MGGKRSFNYKGNSVNAVLQEVGECQEVGGGFPIPTQVPSSLQSLLAASVATGARASQGRCSPLTVQLKVAGWAHSSSFALTSTEDPDGAAESLEGGGHGFITCSSSSPQTDCPLAFRVLTLERKVCLSPAGGPSSPQGSLEVRKSGPVLCLDAPQAQALHPSILAFLSGSLVSCLLQAYLPPHSQDAGPVSLPPSRGSPSPLAPLALAPLSPWLTSRVMSCQAGLMDGGPPRGAPPLPSPSPHLSLHHLFQRQGRPPRGTGPLDKPVAEVGWGDKPVLQWLLQIRNIPAPSGRSLKEERCF